MMSKLQGLVQPEGLSKFKKLYYLIGSRARDHPACSIVSVGITWFWDFVHSSAFLETPEHDISKSRSFSILRLRRKILLYSVPCKELILITGDPVIEVSSF
jgi:hypothetical protein